jgi:hypothetical protein
MVKSGPTDLVRRAPATPEPKSDVKDEPQSRQPPARSAGN